ncbi:putative bifunctional diguanylate cyclase/phosphodiesterase [Actinomycetes bacterium M1A6_2h]
MSWTRALTLGVLGVLAYLVVPSAWGQSVVYYSVAGLSIAGVAFGTRTNWPNNPVAARLFTIGVSAWVGGDVVVGLQADRNAPVSVAEPLYIAGYIGIICALATVTVGGRRVIRTAELLESAIVAVGVGLASWTFVVVNRSPEIGGNTWAAVVYTNLDVFLLAILGYFLSSRRSRSATLGLIAAALTLMAVTDYTSYVLLDPLGRYSETAINAAWLLSYVLMAAAVLHPIPSIDPDREPRARVEPSLPTGRLILLTFAISIAPVVMVIELARGLPVETWGWVVVSSSAVLTLLASTRAYVILRDLRRYARKVHDSARTDLLTGLANRLSLTEWVEELLEIHDHEGVALLVVDLDRFSHINETFGYGTGDRVLTEVGARIGSTLGSNGVVGRLGGDEFVVVLAPDARHDTATSTARAIRQVVGEELRVGDIELGIEVTVGIALSSSVLRPGAEVLFQRAHLAMAEAKRRQPRLAVYNRTMDIDRHRQLRLMSEIPGAIAAQELRLYYQPLLDLRTGSVSGVEALLRWQHPVDGLLSPGDFLPSAEQTGMLPSITTFVLREAFSQCRRWRDDGRELYVAVNLSVRNLVDSTLPEQVRNELSRADLPGSAIAFEVTESDAMSDPTTSIETLLALRALGSSISVDDYGTGHSSLAYLSSLPVQQLKIDRSFVTTMTSDPANAAIVRSTVDLARNLGVGVLAEGVEDDATLSALRQLGCDAAQGFHIASPMPAGAVLSSVSSIEGKSGVLA